jgi:hypothetical protein
MKIKYYTAELLLSYAYDDKKIINYLSQLLLFALQGYNYKKHLTYKMEFKNVK